MTYTETAEKADRIYKTAESSAELKGACVSLAEVIREITAAGQADSELGQNIASLFLRVRATQLFLAYIENGYYENDMTAAADFCADRSQYAAGKGWKNTAELLIRVKNYIAKIDSIMYDAAALADSVRDRFGDSVSAAEDVFKTVKSRVDMKIEVLGGMPNSASVFGEKVKMPDVVSKMNADLADLSEFCAQKISEFNSRDDEKFFAAHVKIIDCAAVPSLCPKAVPDRTDAGLIVLRTPFPDEAELAVSDYARSQNAQLVSISGASLCAMNETDAARLFSILQEKRPCLYIDDGRRLDDGISVELMKLGKTIKRIFVVDGDGSGSLYSRMFKLAIASDGLSATDAAENCLSVPQYSEFMLALHGAGLVADAATDENVRKTMPFSGYIGLNAALCAAAAGGSWRNAGADVSERRYESAVRYISALPTQILLLDLGWGEYAADRSAREKAKSGTFDYDFIADIDPENLRRIAESPALNMFERCGGLALYCTLCGMDRSVWDVLPLEKKAERIAVAVKFVSRALDNMYDPEVSVVGKSELDEGAGGQCVDGGKIIKFGSDAIKDPEWTIGAICHECYHAFQHTAVATGFKLWYWSELGVTEGRIDRWKNNFSVYEGDVNSVTYKVEVVESDAVAFEKDCMAVCVKALATVGL